MFYLRASAAMRFAVVLVVLPMVALHGFGQQASQGQAAPMPYTNPKLPVEQRVDDLVGRMTLEEKVE